MKKLLSTLVLLIALQLSAQSPKEPEFGGVAISLSQDLKFMTIGDKERGYDAYTRDILVKVKLKGRKKRGQTGRSFALVEYENAALEFGYERISAGFGRSFGGYYTPKFLFIPEIDWSFAPSVSYGLVIRGGKNKGHFNVIFENTARISDTFNFVMTHQLTQRQDLAFVYGDRGKWKYSFLVGFEIKINVFQPTKTAN